MKRVQPRTLIQELLLLPLCKSSTNVRPTGQSHASYSKGLDIDEDVRPFRGRYGALVSIDFMLAVLIGTGWTLFVDNDFSWTLFF